MRGIRLCRLFLTVKNAKMIMELFLAFWIRLDGGAILFFTSSGRLFDAGFEVSGHYRVAGGRPQYIVFAMCLSVYEGAFCNRVSQHFNVFFIE